MSFIGLARTLDTSEDFDSATRTPARNAPIPTDNPTVIPTLSPTILSPVNQISTANLNIFWFTYFAELESR